MNFSLTYLLIILSLSYLPAIGAYANASYESAVEYSYQEETFSLEDTGYGYTSAPAYTIENFYTLLGEEDDGFDPGGDIDPSDGYIGVPIGDGLLLLFCLFAVTYYLWKKRHKSGLHIRLFESKL